ncbi:MAG: hypothetical protein QOK49_4269, partial [Baekduia sp.]|nr:hypothetical protein [Baekduia sp.]
TIARRGVPVLAAAVPVPGFRARASAAQA